jgi:hypothetical protein
MLCIENDDDSAALQRDLLASAGITPRDLTPWNAYPWFRYDQNSGLTSPKITEGPDPLRWIVDNMQDLEVALLQGGEAQTLWKRFARKAPRLAGRYAVVETYHPAGPRCAIPIRKYGKHGRGADTTPSRKPEMP